jgi:hypothetical protein
MEYRTKAQFQAKMVMWRDVDAAVIAGWIDRSNRGRMTESAFFAAGHREIPRPRRHAAARRRQVEDDCQYIFNCA